MNYNFLTGLKPINKILILVSFDILIALFATWLSFSIRLETIFIPDMRQVPVFLFSFSYLIFFIYFGIYKSITRYITILDLKNIIIASILYLIFLSTIIFYLNINGVPRSISLMQPLLFCILILISRLSIVGIFKITRNQKKILIYGAGSAGFKLSNLILNSKKYTLVGFIDDNIKKVGRQINNQRIYSFKEIKDNNIIHSIHLVIIAIPTLSISSKNEIYNRLKSYKFKIRSVPSIDELIDRKLTLDDIKDIELEEILNRERQDNTLNIENKLDNQTVLVTGAGGSIGSELCLQILKCHPKKLIILDNSELNLYNLESKVNSLNLTETYQIEIVYSLTDIKDDEIVQNIFKLHSPNYVFHAAAYKHVPMVEKNIYQAVQNNVFGTKKLIEVSVKYSVSNFILISTDKAVNPSSIMGKTKRISELIVQAYAEKKLGTIMSIVRFGNVLDSSGSVIPLFKKQIESMSAVTVTHPDVTRYFMLIPEAVNLILHTLKIAKGGEVFVLDMGNPIKILDLAKQMIRLRNLKIKEEGEDGDIEIKFIGLRKGEKMHEELMIGNNYSVSKNKKIFIAFEDYISLDNLEEKLQKLDKSCKTYDENLIKQNMDIII